MLTRFHHLAQLSHQNLLIEKSPTLLAQPNPTQPLPGPIAVVISHFPMASEEDHIIYNDEELDDEDDDDEEDEDLNPSGTNSAVPIPSLVVDDEEDDDVDVDDDEVDDSTSSSNLAAADLHLPDPVLQLHLPTPPQPPLPSVAKSSVAAGEVTIGLAADHPPPSGQRIDDVTVASVPTVSRVIVEEKKPVPLDDSRRLFQRLWTDEDEIELLQGFLDYNSSKGASNSSHHHDTTAFYDQIKSKLQLDFNKNQLVEKLRRLKKKYRNVMGKIGSGKEYVFKSPHDQATFEISQKIWSGGIGNGGSVTAMARGGGVAEVGGFDDEDANPNFSLQVIDRIPNLNGIDINSFDKKTPRSRKRSRAGAFKVEEKQYVPNSIPNLQHCIQQPNVQNVATGMVTPTATLVGTGSGSGANLIEGTVKTCLSPLIKEVLNSVMNLNGAMGGSRGLNFGFALSPMPLVLTGDLMSDEKWRKQQILELEVYSKRLELVQDQIKAQLEELRSMGS